MSDEKIKRPKLNVVSFDPNAKKDEKAAETAQFMQKILSELATRAADGDITDFIITFKSKRGTESMIGGDVSAIDYIGYVGMLEVLKNRLLQIMSRMSYAYSVDKDTGKTNKPDEVKKDEPETPKD